MNSRCPYKRLGGFALVAVLTSASIVYSMEPISAQRAETDRLIAEAVEGGFAGQILAVVDGEVVLHAGYGSADAAGEVLIDTSTVFAIGSVTKAFTRAAVLKLAEEGRLSLSDTLSEHLEGVPADKRDITLDQLLRMRAGFHEYHDDSGDHQPMSREEALLRIFDQKLRFAPGSEEAYSNSGYTLLAAIIENVSGQPYPEYVRQKLIEPAGMEHSGFHGEDRWPDADVARGRNGRMHADNAPHHWPFPTWALTGAGGMVANAEDLLRWIRAVRGGDVLGPDALARFYPKDDPHRVYAGGDDFGFITVVMEIDHDDDVIIVNTNAGYRPMALAADVIGALRGEPVPFAVPGQGEPAVEREVSGGDPRGVSDGGIPDSPRGRKAMALMQALEDGSEEALQAVVAEHYSARLRDSFSLAEHMDLLGRLSEQIRAATDLNVRPVDEFSLEIRAVDAGGQASTFVIDLEDKPPHGIVGIMRR